MKICTLECLPWESVVELDWRDRCQRLKYCLRDYFSYRIIHRIRLMDKKNNLAWRLGPDWVIKYIWEQVICLENREKIEVITGSVLNVLIFGYQQVLCTEPWGNWVWGDLTGDWLVTLRHGWKEYIGICCNWFLHNVLL